MAALKYWVWLSNTKLRTDKALKLLEHFDSPERVFFSMEDDFKDIDWLTPGEMQSVLSKNLSKAREIIEKCGENGYRIITMNDAEYPNRLKNIHNPPLLLYIKGTINELDDEAAVAIVGTRSCTPYGVKTAERLAYEITRGGGVVVTGLARGVDSAAAAGALRAGGRVVGVLGCGLDIVYPPENKALFEDVAVVGALISEYPPGTEPSGYNFPARNRIMSGISAGVLVVEAPLHSGALITASRALEQGRDVFAVPGNVDAESCRGSNALLKEGAEPVTEGQDILAHYEALYPEKIIKNRNRENVALDDFDMERLVSDECRQTPKRHKLPKKVIDNDSNLEYIDVVDKANDLSDDEKNVVSAIKEQKNHVDEIIEESGLGAARVLSALTMLELKGYVVQQQGKRFVLEKQQN